MSGQNRERLGTLGFGSGEINEEYYIQLNNDLRNAKPGSSSQEMWKKVKKILMKATEITEERAEAIHSRLKVVTEDLQALKPDAEYQWTSTKFLTDRVDIMTNESLGEEPVAMDIYLFLERICSQLSKQRVGYRFWGMIFIKRLVTSKALLSALLDPLAVLGIENPSWQLLMHIFYEEFDMETQLFANISEYLTDQPMKNITLPLHMSSLICTTEVCYRLPPRELTLTMQKILAAYKLDQAIEMLLSLSTFEEYHKFCWKLPRIKMNDIDLSAVLRS